MLTGDSIEIKNWYEIENGDQDLLNVIKKTIRKQKNNPEDVNGLYYNIIKPEDEAEAEAPFNLALEIGDDQDNLFFTAFNDNIKNEMLLLDLTNKDHILVTINFDIDDAQDEGGFSK